MREATVNGRSVVAGPESPEEAFCPRCGAVVTKRSRRRTGGGVTYFYRHAAGEGEGCPLRYRPDG